MVLPGILLFFAFNPAPNYKYSEPCKPRETFRSFVLTDLESQVPTKVGNAYRHQDAITHGHEATHAINDRLSKPGYQAVYLLNKQFLSFKIPSLKLQDVQPYIPESLQLHRYHTYVVKQSTIRYENVNGTVMLVYSHNANPFYLLNEWVAYNNGAAVGMELAGLNIYPKLKNDLLLAPLEMSTYVLGLCCAIKDKDPDYWKDAHEFKLFMKNELQRSLKLYNDSQKLDKFKWENNIARDMKQTPHLRAMLAELGVNP